MAAPDPNRIPFADAFDMRLADLQRRANACGSSISGICADTGVARATVERWMKRPPKTVQIYDTLRARVLELERGLAEKVAEQRAQVTALDKVVAGWAKDGAA